MLEQAPIVGEVIAGHSAKVRQQLEELVGGIEKTTLDIAELMYEIKEKSYFTAWGFNTFREYIEQVKFKPAKAYYLVRIIAVMKAIGAERKDYEPLGLSKLREISTLDPAGTFAGKPMKDFIFSLLSDGKDKSLDEIKKIIHGLKGLDGEDELVWMNVCVKRAAREQTIKPALNLAKMNIGSTRDEEGNAVDASDGAALEMIAVEYLNDPANLYLATHQQETEEKKEDGA